MAAVCPQGDTTDLMGQIGRLSPRGSVVFHDAVSANYVNLGIVVSTARVAAASRHALLHPRGCVTRNNTRFLWHTHPPRGS